MPRNPEGEGLRAAVCAAVRQHRMFSPGERVIVALSGGPDSVALLHALLASEGELGARLSACHLNHRLRGEEAGRDEAFVRALCAQWGVPLYAFSEDVRAAARARGISEELAGREIRYRLFGELAQREGAKIATAHQLTDQVETVLFRLTRRAGLDGLCGIPPVRGPFIRPLLGCTRAEVEDYCREEGLPFVVDSTNGDETYARNRIRLQVLPALRQLNPSLEKTVTATAGYLAQDRDFLNLRAAEAYADCKGPGDGVLPSLNAAAFAALHPALQGRVARLFLTDCALPATALAAEAVARLAAGKEGERELAAGRYLRRRGDLLVCRERTAPPPPAAPCELAVGKSASIFGKTLTLCVTTAENGAILEKVHKNHLINCMDYDKLKTTLVARGRREGDSIALSRRGVTKTLKKLFCELGIPPQERGRVPVIADGEGVVCIPGVDVAARVAVTGKTERIAVLYCGEDV